jgi:hypothetical protein
MENIFETALEEFEATPGDSPAIPLPTPFPTPIPTITPVPDMATIDAQLDPLRETFGTIGSSR